MSDSGNTSQVTVLDEERSGSAADDEEEDEENGSGSGSGGDDDDDDEDGSGSGSGDEDGSDKEEEEEEEEEEEKRPPPNKYLSILNTLRDINMDLDSLDRDVDRVYTKATARSSIKQRTLEEPRRNFHSAMSREEIKKSFSP